MQRLRSQRQSADGVLVLSTINPLPLEEGNVGAAGFRQPRSWFAQSASCPWSHHSPQQRVALKDSPRGKSVEWWQATSVLPEQGRVVMAWKWEGWRPESPFGCTQDPHPHRCGLSTPEPGSPWWSRPVLHPCRKAQVGRAEGLAHEPSQEGGEQRPRGQARLRVGVLGRGTPGTA